ncbi:uncharacterized protein Z518_06510 [Rhinocladiella mackenziei CBS 650.93]|uniref:WSC domain-containing protein n=1 Tax=Rhinocladiella mackenziei CBS 650.93 TaxID=1442369 RepID=A0A0D2J237_9EURO|nr:uncharacterized protein Z518_06510 [Rhinocladiella mackenziei CBS 650.93]KIX02960.1 hypothetical protein Z518_06510 [Rhinocladiella mackenziei CBS 650.93]
MAMGIELSTFFLLLWILPVRSIEVTITSSCTSLCNGPSLTVYTDLSCSDHEYFDSDKGDTMRDCLTCESTSSADNGDLSTPQNNDIYWFLFNMKYTLQYCLFQENGSTPSLPDCEVDCAGLYPVLTTSWFLPAPAKQYEYCSINDMAFPQYADTCASCLQAGTGSVVLGNFLNAMQSACDSKPDATLGEMVPLQRELFDTTTVNPSAATSMSTSSASAPASTSVSESASATESTFSATTAAASSSSTTTAAPTSDSSGISAGAAAGIGVSCGLGAIAIIGGLFWFILTRARRRNQRNKSGCDFKDAKEMPSPLYEPLTRTALNRAYAQQLASSEVHEIDSTQNVKVWSNELDGRPVRGEYR